MTYTEDMLRLRDREVEALRKKVEELMDDGYEFGEAVKEAVKQLENG